MRIVLVVVALLMGTAQASPTSSFKTVGSTTLNWMFWKIYDISLLTETGTYQQGPQPLALEITYARDIEGEQLLTSTIEEWDRQEINWKQDWSARLQNIYPDVTEGDQLVLRVDDDNNSFFYFNEQPVGTIEDSGFTDAFLAIWLSSNSRFQKMTRELTGSS